MVAVAPVGQPVALGQLILIGDSPGAVQLIAIAFVSEASLGPDDFNALILSLPNEPLRKGELSGQAIISIGGRSLDQTTIAQTAASDGSRDKGLALFALRAKERARLQRALKRDEPIVVTIRKPDQTPRTLSFRSGPVSGWTPMFAEGRRRAINALSTAGKVGQDGDWVITCWDTKEGPP